MSLSPSRNPAGSTDGSEWLSSTRMLPPWSPTGNVGVQPAVLDAQVIEVAQGLAGEVAKLGVVALGLQLGDDHDGQDHPVLGESADGSRVGQQHAGVEDVGTPRLILPAGPCW